MGRETRTAMKKLAADMRDLAEKVSYLAEKARNTCIPQSWVYCVAGSHFHYYDRQLRGTRRVIKYAEDNARLTMQEVAIE